MSDLIDRKELLSNADVFTMHTKEYGSIEVISVDAVGDAPTVDAVPLKHGKPIPHYVTLLNSDDEPVETYRCGYECPFCGDTGIKNFCSNCGARMESCR